MSLLINPIKLARITPPDIAESEILKHSFKLEITETFLVKYKKILTPDINSRVIIVKIIRKENTMESRIEK